MATGDYHHTALAVARGVGMLSPKAQVIIIQAEKETQPPSSVLKGPLAARDHAAPQSPRQVSLPVLTTPVAWTLDKTPQLAGLSPSLVTYHPQSVIDVSAADWKGGDRQTSDPSVQRPPFAINMAANGREREIPPPVAQHSCFVAGSAVGGGKERQDQLLVPHQHFKHDLSRTCGVEQQSAGNMASDTCPDQTANDTISASRQLPVQLPGHLPRHLPALLPSSRQLSRMRGGGTIHRGLVFDVDNGSVAPNQALQAVTAIAQVHPSSLTNLH